MKADERSSDPLRCLCNISPQEKDNKHFFLAKIWPTSSVFVATLRQAATLPSAAELCLFLVDVKHAGTQIKEWQFCLEAVAMETHQPQLW